MKTTVFLTNKTQAVRIPKDLAFPDYVKSVDIVDTGAGRLITPSGTSWDAFFDQLDTTEDFMADRAQPMPQERDNVFPGDEEKTG